MGVDAKESFTFKDNKAVYSQTAYCYYEYKIAIY